MLYNKKKCSRIYLSEKKGKEAKMAGDGSLKALICPLKVLINFLRVSHFVETRLDLTFQ